MFSKAKIALVAIAFLGSASAASAQSGGELWMEEYLRNPNAPTPTYQQSAQHPRSFQHPRAQRFEGRNVGDRFSRSYRGRGTGTGTYQTIPSFGGY